MAAPSKRQMTALGSQIPGSRPKAECPTSPKAAVLSGLWYRAGCRQYRTNPTANCQHDVWREGKHSTSCLGKTFQRRGCSVQREDFAIQHSGERYPHGIGHKQPCRAPVSPPGRSDETEYDGEKKQNNCKGNPNPVGGEEHRRPEEIEYQLHRPTTAVALEAAPAGHCN